MKAKRRSLKTEKHQRSVSTATTASEDAARTDDDGDAGMTAHSADDENVTRRLSPSRRLLFLAVPYLIFALALFAVEAGTRLLLPRVSMLDAVVDAPQQRLALSDSERVTIFEGDARLLWRLKPNLANVVWDFTPVSTNSRGLRYDGEINAKTPGALRVVCLGDSVTFGYRVPVVWAARPNDYDRAWLPYPALLEKALRAANPGRRIEVIPLAVPGYTSRQGLAWLRRDIEELQPDVVTILYGWNDVNLSPLPDKQTMSDDTLHIAFRALMSHSQALTHATLWIKSKRATANKNAPPATAPTQRVSASDFVGNILEAARLSANQGARAVVIAPVYRDQVTNPTEAALMAKYRDDLRAATQQANVPYLEIRELMEDNYPANEALFGELIHPNHLGHRLLATELLRFFKARGLLAGVNVPQEL